jgi:S-adenosylmethionine hydrolase
MPVITLTTDWGTTDHYVAAFKGGLLSLHPEATLVDVSHSVPSFDSMRAAFIFKNCYNFFPSGSIHLVSVGSLPSQNSGWLAIEDNSSLILCRNDGFFTLVAERQPQKAVVISNSEKITVANERNFLLSAINSLIEKKQIDSLGEKVQSVLERSLLMPTLEENLIRGTVVYIDSFGNAITNITKEFFETERKNRAIEIDFPRKDVIVTGISKHYRDAARGQMLVLFNSSGYLEIAQNQGDAAGLYGLEYGDQIRIQFK